MPWDAAMVSDRAWDCFVTQAAGGQRAVSHSGRVQSGRNARNGDLTRRLHGFEEAAVVAHDDQRPFVGLERTLELIDRGEVEVVRRLVEHEQVHAAGCHERDARTRSLARRQRGGRAEHVIRTEAELREQRPRLLGRDVRARREAVHERLRAECVSALIELADHRARTEPPFAAHQRQPAEQSLEERRLAAPVRPRHRNPLASAEHQVERAEPEGAPRQDRRIEPRDEVASARRRRQGQPEIPRLPGLVDPLERLEPPLDRARPLRERLLQPPARALAGGRRLRLPAAEGVLELAPPLVVAPVRGVLVLALQSPEAYWANPPAYSRALLVRSSSSTTRSTVRSRKARSCETTTMPASECATNRSRTSNPAKSRSLVGSSSRSTSWRATTIEASAARAASPPERPSSPRSRPTSRPTSRHAASRRQSSLSPERRTR